jgi:hypothetical protein
MHDCRQTQDNLIDLIFDEPDSATHARLRSEVETCAMCDAQYRSLTRTLDACDAAAAAMMPRENYWPQYHAALTRRLHVAARGDVTTATATTAAVGRISFWKRWLTTSIRVPAPIAACAMLALVAVSVLALALLARPAPEPVLLAAPNSLQGETAPQIKFIEVPVVEEKIITQTIYVPQRNNNSGSSGQSRRAAWRENLAGVGRRNAPAPEATAPPSPRANLSGFKPAGEVNLRIIKGSDAREQ